MANCTQVCFPQMLPSGIAIEPFGSQTKKLPQGSSRAHWRGRIDDLVKPFLPLSKGSMALWEGVLSRKSRFVRKRHCATKRHPVFWLLILYNLWFRLETSTTLFFLMSKCLRKKLIDVKVILGHSRYMLGCLQTGPLTLCQYSITLVLELCIESTPTGEIDFFSRPFWLRAVGGVQIEMERLSRLSLQVYFRPQISQEKGLIWYKTFFWSLPLKVVLPLHPQIFRFWSSQPFLPKQDQGALEVFIFIITVNHCIWRSARWIKLSSKGTRRYGAQHSTWHGCDETSGRVTQLHQDNGEPGCSSCSSSKRSWSSSWSRVTPTAGSCQQEWASLFLRRGQKTHLFKASSKCGIKYQCMFRES